MDSNIKQWLPFNHFHFTRLILQRKYLELTKTHNKMNIVKDLIHCLELDCGVNSKEQALMLQYVNLDQWKHNLRKLPVIINKLQPEKMIYSCLGTTEGRGADPAVVVNGTLASLGHSAYVSPGSFSRWFQSYLTVNSAYYGYLWA